MGDVLSPELYEWLDKEVLQDLIELDRTGAESEEELKQLLIEVLGDWEEKYIRMRKEAEDRGDDEASEELKAKIESIDKSRPKLTK